MRPIRQRNSQRLKILNKGIVLVGSASLTGLFIYFLFFFEGISIKYSKAYENKIVAELLSKGQVLCYFDWNQNPVTKSATGQVAVSSSNAAECTEGGVGNTNGLSAGRQTKDVNIMLAPKDEFNLDGIDISLDYKRLEESGNFYSRGSYFNFGMKKGKLVIAYRIMLSGGKYLSFNETTDYEVPMDDEYRNYRFIYDPTGGKAEILVNNAAVWSQDCPPRTKLYWNSNDNIFICKGMNGNGTGRAFADNFVICATSKVSSMPFQLLNFSAVQEDATLRVSWTTLKETDCEEFILERSANAFDYVEVSRIAAAGVPEAIAEYEFVDAGPAEGINYYKLSVSNVKASQKDLPVIAVKLKKILEASTEPAQKR